MNLLLRSIMMAGLAVGSVFAAPGLTVKDTTILYNGEKIFFSGSNLAWADYNSDVGDNPLNENAWRKAIEGTRSAGGNAMRWWLFNNMSQSPTIDTETHLVSGLKTSTISNMKKALDIAEESGVMVSMCLFSHNLMEPNQWGLYENDKLDITANTKLFTDEGTNAFIENALIPVVKAIGNHNALMTWEVFNEPEGMEVNVGWTTNRLEKSLLQKFTNKVAAAIHAENSELLVSTGSVNIKYQSWWNDIELISVGGESKGTLDFFQTHYYPYYQANEVSPFVNTRAQLASTYMFDAKPLIIGEFPASGWSGDTYVNTMAAKTQISTEECYRNALDGGYAGALAWQYIGDKTESNFGGYSYTIEPALLAMKSLWNTDSSLIKIKDYTAVVDTGNGMMAVTYGGNNAQIEYQKTFDLSSAESLSFMVKNNGTTDADLYLIFKLTDAWTWTETTGSCTVAAGALQKCTFDISTLADRNKTLSIVIANYASGYTGTLLYDDFVAGSDTLFNFNKDKYDAFGRGFNVTEEMIPEIKIVFNNLDYMDIHNIHLAKMGSSINQIGNSIALTLSRAGMAHVDLFDMNGVHVASFAKGNLSAGTHQFSLNAIAKGLYIVKATGNFGSVNKSIVIR